MKLLKNKSTVLLVLILAAALLLSACGTAAILASRDENSSSVSLPAVNSGSSDSVSAAALSAVSGVFDDAFPTGILRETTTCPRR